MRAGIRKVSPPNQELEGSGLERSVQPPPMQPPERGSGDVRAGVVRLPGPSPDLGCPSLWKSFVLSSRSAGRRLSASGRLRVAAFRAVFVTVLGSISSHLYGLCVAAFVSASGKLVLEVAGAEGKGGGSRQDPKGKIKAYSFRL